MRALILNELRGRNHPENALKTLEVRQLRLGLSIIAIVGTYRGGRGVELGARFISQPVTYPLKKCGTRGPWSQGGILVDVRVRGSTLMETLLVLFISMVLSALLIEAAFRVYEAVYEMVINSEVSGGQVRQR